MLNHLFKYTKSIFNLAKFFKVDAAKIRNIGISAHIDSGKTTFSERVLYYAGRIDSIHQVKGSDSVGAKMDFMELQREKGITIQSAATHLLWKDYHINLIDTPGHVDFTIQVERALRVLDGAVLLVCGVGGVQPQTLTVNKQMNRYNVPRIIFINKLDRMGANPWQAIDAIRQKLGINCAGVQIPIGQDEQLKGLIDIIHEKAYIFEGKNGQYIKQQKIPEKLINLVRQKRNELIETLSNSDKQMEQMYLNQKIPTPQQIENCIRRLTLERKFYPVFMGSAYKNKGVQLALDGVTKFLPSPYEKQNVGFKYIPSARKQEKLILEINDKKPFVGYVFKLQQSKFGQLTYIRVYQGKLKKGDYVWNEKVKKKLKVSRMVRMHANQMEQISDVAAGDIFAIFGVECATGQTLTDADSLSPIRCSSMFVPDPVMSLTIKPSKNEHSGKFQKAITKFQRQDPTFRVGVDKQSEQIIISGMGQLHLQIYVQRMKREFGVDVKTGPPSVNYRQTISGKAFFDYLHKKQSGGAGQYARVTGYVQPYTTNDNEEPKNEFISRVTGTAIPPEYIQAVEKAFYEIVNKGPQTGYPVVNFRYVLEDGATHVVDSSANAFAIATRYSFAKAMQDAGALVLEPLMNVQISCPQNSYSGVMAGISKRKGLITNTQTKGDLFVMSADVPLRQMFGYATQLRGLTSGQGQFTMQYKKHFPMNPADAKEAIQKYKIKRKQRD